MVPPAGASGEGGEACRGVSRKWNPYSTMLGGSPLLAFVIPGWYWVCIVPACILQGRSGSSLFGKSGPNNYLLALRLGF